MRRLMIAAALVTAWAGLGRADDPALLGRPGMEQIYVWLNYESWSEGLALIRAGVHETDPQMVIRLLACIAKKGDHAVIVGRPSLAAKTILVIDGAHKGCRGFVTDEDLGM
ncbi:MAG: hypothetical protein E5W81_11780 [Mesorhizobium sp.]|uniref:hypothetical protein n=1 Tax=Mesorhizobium sp. TaxID=1871066 RepID=UPI001205FD95|nr:hypothetical protein [Mesorhizobium sp.]TIT24434.1 MAG: hypothetical protein E5W70_03775 [Mesorhizobium sp.]TKB82398.1 MAG: hypothetical protein E5W81_11780 [Mesorhizobium sp.]